MIELNRLQENPIDYQGLARTLYNAYVKSVSLNVQNQNQLSWENQTEEIKIAWVSVAKVAYNEVVLFVNNLTSK